MATALIHGQLQFQLEWSKNGGIKRAGDWQPFALHDIEQSSSDGICTYSCFVESEPNLFVQAKLQWLTKAGRAAKEWGAKRNQVIKFYLSPGNEPVLLYDVEAGADSSQIRVPGIWANNNKDVKRFRLTERRRGQTPIPKGSTSLDDLACFRLELHHTKVKGKGHESRSQPPPKVDKQLLKCCENKHSGLSEYIRSAALRLIVSSEADTSIGLLPNVRRQSWRK